MISPTSQHLTTLTELQVRKLMKLFSMYDADNVGVLKMRNFQTLVDRLAAVRNWKPETPEYNRLQAKIMQRWVHIRGEIKEKLKGSKDSSVTLEQWLLFYDQVLSDSSYRDHIQEVADLIFDAVDVDASETLDLAEWQRLFQIYGIPVIYAQESFAKVGLSPDQSLSKDEVVKRIEEFYYSQDPNAPGNFLFGPF